MLSQVKPPFRAEHIGSLLRPTALLQQRAKFGRGEIDAPRSARPRGVQLVGSSSDATALAAYHQLHGKYASILGGREPRVLHHGLARGSMGWARVHVGTESRAGAEKLCAELRAAGASCMVQRN